MYKGEREAREGAEYDEGERESQCIIDACESHRIYVFEISDTF